MSKTNNPQIPAIAGGEPAKKTPYGTASRYGEEELKELREAIEQGTLFYTGGNKVKSMEEKFAKTIGMKYGVATSSGTASLHTALTALGISPGDEVIVPPITDMGSIIPILYQGAVPVFADIEPHSYVMSPEAAEKAVTKKTKAIMPVHLWGNACDMDAFKEIGKKRGIFIVEDCAQAWGCIYKGKHVGTFGDVGCFSFNEWKHISSGEGGVVTTNSEELATRLRMSSDKCYDRSRSSSERNPLFLANNYRMTELQAAVALAQLDKLENIIDRRRRWCGKLIPMLSDIEGITLPQPTAGCDPSWWFFMIRVIPEVLGADVPTFKEAIKAEGVGAGVHGTPVYEYTIFQEHSAFQRGYHPYNDYEYRKGMCPVAESVLETAITLPVNEAFTDDDAEETGIALRRLARWFREKKQTI